ncbi:MAG TPA: hypothetical protein VIY09_00140, partial [Rhizomicrobium sp.]
MTFIAAPWSPQRIGIKPIITIEWLPSRLSIRPLAWIAASRFAMGKALSVRRTLEAITSAMALVLVVISAILANRAYDQMRRAERTVTASGITRDLFMSMQNRRFELGTVSTVLESPRAADAETWADIEQVRARSTAALNRALFGLAMNNMGTASERAAIVKERTALDGQRSQIDAALRRPELRSAARIARWVP